MAATEDFSLLVYDNLQTVKKFTSGMEQHSEYSLFYTDDNDFGFLLIIGKHLPDYKE
jgi:hypothetical protein